MKLFAATAAFVLSAACASSPPTRAPDHAHTDPDSAADADRSEQLEKRVNILERSVELLTVLNQKVLEQIATLNETVANMPARPTPTRRGPDPAVVYSIPVQDNPFWGPADAKVTIVKAMEFACPACERARPFVDELEKEFLGESVRFVYKTFVVHPTRATLPARAGCAAHLQDKFFAIYPLMWDAFAARKFDGKPDDEQDLLDVAAQVKGMDMKQFEVDMAGVCVNIVTSDHGELRKIGVGGTPTFFVNGRVLTERTVDAVKKLVTEELASADERIANGSAQADYYIEWVVQKGKTSK
jgi:protein-disulfide isomerase